MIVPDTSAYINGQRDHLPPRTFPTVWTRVSEAIENGKAVLPRAVYKEITEQDDDIADWIKARKGSVVEPGEDVQRLAGEFAAEFSGGPTRNDADPFVLAEAQHRGFTVVTYEGRSFSGVPTTRWQRSMPGICQHFGIPCCTLPEALEKLGVQI